MSNSGTRDMRSAIEQLKQSGEDKTREIDALKRRVHKLTRERDELLAQQCASDESDTVNHACCGMDTHGPWKTDDLGDRVAADASEVIRWQASEIRRLRKMAVDTTHIQGLAAREILHSKARIETLESVDFAAKLVAEYDRLGDLHSDVRPGHAERVELAMHAALRQTP